MYSLGIDIGSVSLCYVLIDDAIRIVDSGYLFHHGNIAASLRRLLKKIEFSQVSFIGYNQRSSEFIKAGHSCNEQIALVEGIRYQCQQVRSLFMIGGETFGLILFDEKNQYQKYISNSSCAAGTGSFLDQQAERLGLRNSAELSQLALTYEEDPPKIATRCAVFAKTDLIHCQQQGYSVPAICAGLCKGLAQNIADTLLGGIILNPPVAVTGGLSQNHKVLDYLSQIIGRPLLIPKNALLTVAIGCAIDAREKNIPVLRRIRSVDEILKKQTLKKHYFFESLQLRYSEFPDFSDHQHYLDGDVEIDLYQIPVSVKKLPVYIGLDIGSTSTKLLLMIAGKKKKNILCGLYTRTRGQPIVATQSLFRVIDRICQQYELSLRVCAVGTTGSGRKFIEKILHADYAIDEITAHARAAYELNPKTDTIIEIGGQDSKFTVMKKGQVTFSVMNYVCAAGTGSFIEEQANRLDVALDEYSALAMRSLSPLSSDRCTVFMERDLNHFLAQGYSRNELLAAVLHSVRDNYLAKVAHLNKIGDYVCFQGATAKNRALISAFEQKLQKPIFVSKFCHLTGALGVCHLLKELKINKSRFRGLEFHNEKFHVGEEICDKCNNHCKLNKIRFTGETITWGYLCGRDESGNTDQTLRKTDFDFLRSRRQVFSSVKLTNDKQTNDPATDVKPFLGLDLDFSFDKLRENFEVNFLNLRHKMFTISQGESQSTRLRYNVRIGLPDTLYMKEYLPFWHYLFKKMGYAVIRSSGKRSFLKSGKNLSASEYCAPIAALHGNIADLYTQVDYIFVPQMFKEGQVEKRNYCYYSNYVVSIIKNLPGRKFTSKMITPKIDFSQPALNNIQQIYESLPQRLKIYQSPAEIQEVYHAAWQWFIQQRQRLIEIFKEHRRQHQDICVVLIGRPYTILDSELNKNIQQKFIDQNVATAYQDMLPVGELVTYQAADEFISWNHWKYGEEILKASEYIGQTKGLYPVYLSAFKCSPDSFLLPYFREIMNIYDRPYLILQIDEHGSDVGYQTRIEAAVRTFQSHFKQKSITIRKKKDYGIHLYPYHPKKILIPDYDTLSCSLIAAAFQKAGYDAYLLEESTESIAASLRLNDGQCLPLSAIAQSTTQTIKNNQLKIEDTALFLNTITNLACNFPQYPLMARKIFEDIGGGFEKLQIFATDFEMKEFAVELVSDIYIGYLLGGLLRLIGCRIRPYEEKRGHTDQVIEQGRQTLYQATINKRSRQEAFEEVVEQLANIRLVNDKKSRPKVSIIGDLYVRDNDVFNQQLVHELEEYGAEVVTTPFTFILRILAFKHKNLLKEDSKYISLVKFGLLIEYLEQIEKRYYKIAQDLMQESFPALKDELFDHLHTYSLTLDHSGETAQNLLKIFALIDHYPDLSIFIHVNPIFCCPGLVSESIFKQVEKDIDKPIISITYDGTQMKRHQILAPYIHYLKKSII